MASTLDIQIEQGSTFERTVTVLRNGQAVDLTSATAKLDIRQSPGAPTALLTLTDTSGLTLHTATGEIDWLITDEQSATLTPLTNKKGSYDLKITDSTGKVFPRLRGSVEFIARTTV